MRGFCIHALSSPGIYKLCFGQPRETKPTFGVAPGTAGAFEGVEDMGNRLKTLNPEL
ncbi:hypothetical protein OKW41_006114 [Paraburkholderia sp. UCT70]